MSVVGKRSRRVQLSTMSAVAGTVLLAGCGSDPVPSAEEVADAKAPKSEVLAFGDVFECEANSDLSKQQCADARKQAIAAGEQIGPRFEGQGDCENEWGAGSCVEQSHGGRSFFSPFVTGFLIGKMFDGGRREYLPLYRRAGENGYATANGARLGYAGAPGKYYAVARALERPKAIAAIKANTGAVARGGMLAMSDGDSDSHRSRFRAGG